MISQPLLKHQDNGTISCAFPKLNDPMKPLEYLEEENGPLNVCTTQDVIDALNKTKANRSNSNAPVKYLMGFNEMYNDPVSKDGNDLKPREAAYYWRKYIQPAAEANKLDLVSPTVGGTARAVTWFANFLKKCYDKRNNEEYPCKIKLIKKFALHHYDCRESKWVKWFGGENSRLMRMLTEELGTYGGKKNWGEYVRSRDIWVTETNCYWENRLHAMLGDPHPSSKEQCLRVTGQKQETHGKGSLVTMEGLDNIERYAWWTMWSKQIKPNYVTYEGGHLSPIGRAYLSPGNTSMDCEFKSSELMGVRDAIVSYPAENSNCRGTEMVR